MASIIEKYASEDVTLLQGQVISDGKTAFSESIPAKAIVADFIDSLLESGHMEPVSCNVRLPEKYPDRDDGLNLIGEIPQVVSCRDVQLDHILAGNLLRDSLIFPDVRCILSIPYTSLCCCSFDLKTEEKKGKSCSKSCFCRSACWSCWRFRCCVRPAEAG